MKPPGPDADAIPMKIHRSIQEPIREGLSWEQRWQARDNGLIACWERGRRKRSEDPELARNADAGQLVVLPWKGGIEKATKTGKRFGCLNYLAMWQGLRSEDLDIDTIEERSVVCTASDMAVVFTGDTTKYSAG